MLSTVKQTPPSYYGNVTKEQMEQAYSYLPDAEYRCYGNMTREEQDAVRKLGYTIDGWHLGADIEGLRDFCEWPAELEEAGVFAPSEQRYDCMASKQFIEKPLHQVYFKDDWLTMTTARRGAYANLGFSDPTDTPAEVGAKWDHRYEIPFPSTRNSPS